jgi:hypothetical protein
MAKGVKTGGRQKGSANRITKAKEAAIADSGLTPLDYMLAVLRDLNEPKERRAWAAQSAAPYCHAKLANVQHSGDAENPIHVVAYTDADRAAALLAFMAKTKSEK